MIDRTAIYVLWLREMKRFFRAKSRIFGTVAMPLFFLLFLGMGFKRIPVPGISEGVEYLRYLVPGIIGMNLLFSSTFGGLSVLWDREFGFLKEIMVAPVSRVSIVIGRISGGVTTALIQGFFILGVTSLFGFRIKSFLSLGMAFVFMLLISVAFLGLGLIFASKMKDMQGFSMVMNFVIFPLFFLSGAIFPVENFPTWLRYISHLDPLKYGVDGLRGVLAGISSYSILFNFVMMVGLAMLMILLGAYFFEKSESV